MKNISKRLTAAGNFSKVFFVGVAIMIQNIMGKNSETKCIAFHVIAFLTIYFNLKSKRNT